MNPAIGSKPRPCALSLFITAGVVGLLAVIAWAIPAEETTGPPDVVILDELEDLYAPVPFEHRIHAEMAEMWGGCETCHHRTPNGHTTSGKPSANGEAPHTQDESADIPACKSCHPVEKEKSDIRMPSLNAAYHRQCLDCHRDWDHEKSCVVCHEPKDSAKTTGEMPTPDDVVGRMHPPADPPVEVVYEARFTPAAGRFVTFRHSEHVDSFGFQCVDCHRSDTCASCHSKEGENARRKPLRPAESWRLSHEPCITCHDHQTCDHCHHKSSDDPPPNFEHRMTGQLLDEDHDDLLCRSCHGSVNFTAVPTCGDASCHKSPELAAYPDRRPGEQITSSMPAVRRQSITAVLGLMPRVDRADQTRATDTIITETAPMPEVRRESRMTTVDRPTTASDSCVTSECHVAIKSYDVVHGPVAIDACGVCHEVVDEQEHQFAIIRDRQALCTYCHEFDVEAMPIVHTPTKEGECLGCHNPHGGHDRTLTRETSIELLCNRCHESMTAQKAFLHSPVDDGTCVSCHSPHASRYPGLLDAIGPDLCMSCHDEFGDQLGRAKFVHKAMDEQCTRCHDVHGSAFPTSLTMPAPELCLDCHEETGVQIIEADYPHSVATEGAACLVCHTPHGGDLASLMRDLSTRVCLECHGESVETTDGRVIAAVGEVMSDDLFKHGQIGDGDCGGCHEPHGGKRELLLAGKYPRGYYAIGGVGEFELCFMCHEEALASQYEVSTGEDSPTQFRNGGLNLHYLHVSNGLGRACRVCHETHTGENTRLIRSAVPYKTWEAPLELAVTETGGRCVTGCHLPFSYDRVTPVALAKQREAGEEVRRIRAEPPNATEVRWQGVDTQGRAVVIPDEERPSLLLFIRGDLGEDLRTVQAVRDAVTWDEDMQVVLVLVGDHFQERSEAIRQSCDPSWSVVSGDQALTTSAKIKAWPIVLMVRPDGMELARIGGAPQSLALKLEAYVDIARMDEVQSLALQSINPNVIGRPAGVDSSQYARVARQLILDGEPNQAEKTLQEAIELHPGDGALYWELISLWSNTGRADHAIGLMDRLPEDTLGYPQAPLLRARAYIKLERWDEAKALVEAVLVTEPEHREAHHMMGLIYQHEGAWREAAESFLRALGPEH